MAARKNNLLRFGVPIALVAIALIIVLVVFGRGGSASSDDTVSPGNDREVQRVEIESVEVQIAESFPVQIFVVVSGYVPDPCWEVQEPVIEQSDQRFEIEIVAERDPDEMCAQVIEPYEESIGLGTVEPGDYVVSVNGVEQSFRVD
jgi:inhibitor of cysteine peptidase